MSPWILWIGVGWLVVLALTLVLMHLRRPRNKLDKLSKAVGLPITHELRPVIELTQQRNLMSTALSSLVALVVGFAILAATGVTQPFEIFYSYFLLLVVAIGLGITVAIVRREGRRQASGVRFARGRAVRRRDYESALWQWAPRITVFVFLIGLATRALITPNPGRDIPVFMDIYAVSSVATLVLVEVASQWIVSRGQPAGSVLELAWDDAFKARSLNSLAIAPLYLGAFGSQVASAVALPDFLEATRSIPGDHYVTSVEDHFQFYLGLLVQDCVGFVALLFLLIAILVENAGKPQQRYLRRLWPELADANTVAINAILTNAQGSLR